jgi:hypothetical protein
MKLWIGGELEADIADSFRDARRSVEKAINDVITANVYSTKLLGAIIVGFRTKQRQSKV